MGRSQGPRASPPDFLEYLSACRGCFSFYEKEQPVGSVDAGAPE